MGVEGIGCKDRSVLGRTVDTVGLGLGSYLVENQSILHIKDLD